jgi:hypothetical protein
VKSRPTPETATVPLLVGDTGAYCPSDDPS